ncbi:MAG: ATP-binding protein [Proteobacteria bacterium]|nr:ATP-binding protein [Pseudomonadota bacterium]
MRIETVSHIIAAFVSGSLGVAALLRNFKSRLTLSFTVLMLALTIHDFIGILRGFSSYETWVGLSWQGFFALLVGLPLLWFGKELLGQTENILGKCASFYIPFLVLVLLFMSFPTYTQNQVSLNFASHTALLIPFIIFLLALDKASHEVSLPREKMRLHFAALGGVVALSVFVTDTLHYSGVENMPPLGTLARILYSIFIFHTFIQKELMTSEEVFTKLTLFGGIALVLTLIYATLVSWVGDQSGLFYFNTFIASFVIMILFEPIKKLVTKSTRRLFLRRNLLLEEELNLFLEGLVGTFEPLELAIRIQGVLKKCLGIENCQLFLLEKDGLSYSRISSAPHEAYEELPSSNALIEYMALRRGRPFVLETVENDKDFFRASTAQNFCETCLETMRTLGSDFIIPIIYESKPIAFCAVRAGERIILSNDQMRVFIPVARQLGLLLKNAQTFNYLKDRDKLAVVGEMAAGLAHEIKNPLGAIKGAAELLKEQKGNEDRASNEFLQIIIDETQRLSNVVTHFLDYAKPRKFHLQGDCDPLKVIDHTAQLALKGSRVSFEVETEEKNPLIEVDAEVLKQILLNLFLNAIQATESMERPSLKVKIRRIKGKRLFSLESLPLFKVWEGWRTENINSHEEHLEIEVKDNGPGIDAETQRRLFIPFFTTKTKGSGLGLAICRRLVESMNGTIQVKSKVGMGTSFVLHLPTKRRVIEKRTEFTKVTERTL